MFKLPNRRRVFLMRHAEAAYVRANGEPATDNRMVELTPLGREQASAHAAALADVIFDRAICSNLPRTQETANIILKGRTQPALEIIPELEEIRFGERLGPGHPSLGDLSGWIAHVANPWADAAAEDARFLGGERFRDFEARVIPTFDRLVRANDWKTLLIVAHGAVNRVVLNHVMGLPWQGTVCIEQDPACINIIDVDSEDGAPARYLVRGINMTSYNFTKAGIYLTDMERGAQRLAEQAKR